MAFRGSPCKAENPLLLQQPLEAAALHHLRCPQSAVPADAAWRCRGRVAQRLSQAVQALPLTDQAASRVSKAVLVFIDVSRFCVCVCLNSLFGDSRCVSEKASCEKKFPILALLQQLRTVSSFVFPVHSFISKPGEMEITRVSSLIDGCVQSHHLIGFALVTAYISCNVSNPTEVNRIT